MGPELCSRLLLVRLQLDQLHCIALLRVTRGLVLLLVDVIRLLRPLRRTRYPVCYFWCRALHPRFRQAYRQMERLAHLWERLERYFWVLLLGWLARRPLLVICIEASRQRSVVPLGLFCLSIEEIKHPAEVVGILVPDDNLVCLLIRNEGLVYARGATQAPLLGRSLAGVYDNSL